MAQSRPLGDLHVAVCLSLCLKKVLHTAMSWVAQRHRHLKPLSLAMACPSGREGAGIRAAAAVATAAATACRGHPPRTAPPLGAPLAGVEGVRGRGGSTGAAKNPNYAVPAVISCAYPGVEVAEY